MNIGKLDKMMAATAMMMSGPMAIEDRRLEDEVRELQLRNRLRPPVKSKAKSKAVMKRRAKNKAARKQRKQRK